MQQYADFSGRARRREFWMFMLFYILMVFGMSFVVAPFLPSSIFSIILVVFAFIHFIPNLAVSVRRLHDAGQSGWWYLISIVPLIGFIVLLVFFCTDSQKGTNKWGPNPKDDTMSDQPLEGILDDF